MEYIIRARFPVNGKHWELVFHRGEAVTEDAALAERYKARGYEVIAPNKRKKKEAE